MTDPVEDSGSLGIYSHWLMPAGSETWDLLGFFGRRRALVFSVPPLQSNIAPVEPLDFLTP
ncbi:MAG: hypothetical protein JWL76_1450 [Thermoleophilia bacterium]|nr:hypothetical protein [Thermoleophilia bacterium]